MSENIVEWRRKWSPDLSAKPWLPFTISDTNLLVKSHFTQTSYSVLVYDFTSMWQQDANTDMVKETAKECNPSVEAPVHKLLEHLAELLEVEQKSAKYSLSYLYHDGDGEDSEERQGDGRPKVLKISMTSKLPQGVPFRWMLSLSKASDEMASCHLTIPLLTLVSELMRREKELQRIIKKKDEEIEDYKASGAKVSRKHKLTQVFDATAFNQEMIHSKAFKSEIERSGQEAFTHQGQELYREVMVTRAWLNRPQDTDGSDNEDIPAGGDPSLLAAGPTAPSWMAHIPGSVAADVPSMADTLSPVKSSPSKSPAKGLSPGVSVQDSELRRREELEKRLADEKAKLMTKKKKKKIF